MTCSANIALLIEVSSSHARGLIRGISRYAQNHGVWRLHLVEQLRAADIRRALEAWPFDGAIARIEQQSIADALAATGLSIVNVGGAATMGNWPRVDTDNAAVCRLAAGHLLDRGYRLFGYCGMPRYQWSGWRKDFFTAELGRQGFACASHEIPSLAQEKSLSQKDQQSLCRWIEGLPKPVGILACNDHCGRAVLEACDAIGAAAPDEVGVLGVDNDDLVCELCSPPLSSIEANCERIGYVAAETLGRMLRGQRGERGETLITPTTLVLRRSTDATAVREPVVAEALRFIRAYACTDIGAMDIARHLNVSRRYLEQQFQRTLDRSIHTEILRVRLETAQRLLGETDWKLQTIAERSGFKQAAHMSAVFHERLRLRPGQYRRSIQSRGPG